ncbi:MAG: (Fe-S)-binding protein [Coriobacteriia bacterium]
MSVEEAREVLSAAEEACVACEVCTDSCEVLSQERLTIGEVVSRVLSGDTGDALVQAIARCNLCGRCCVDCPADIKSRSAMIASREVLGDQGVPVFENYKSLFSDGILTVFPAFKNRYSISYEDLARERCDTVFFPGCSLSTYAPQLTRKVHEWLERDGAEVALLDDCCGATLACAGLAEQEAELRSLLIGKLRSMGAKRIIAPCPNCYYGLGGRGKAMWEESAVLEGVEIASLPSLLLEAGVRVSASESLTFHDSCPDRERGFIGSGVRRLLAGSNLLEMGYSGRHARCCGSGGLVSSVDSKVCETAANRRIADARASGADRLVTACASCCHRLAGGADPGEIAHYLELVFDTPVDWDDVNSKLAVLRKKRVPEGAES